MSHAQKRCGFFCCPTRCVLLKVDEPEDDRARATRGLSRPNDSPTLADVNHRLTLGVVKFAADDFGQEDAVVAGVDVLGRFTFQVADVSVRIGTPRARV